MVGDGLVVGDTAAGTLLIDAGGTVDNNSGYVGYQAGGVGTVTVQGSDGNGNASTWTNDGQLVIGVESGSTGTLNVLNGGRVTNTTDVVIGWDSGSTGNVTVSGPGSTWEHSSGFGFRIGAGGTGTLDINNGGVVHSGQGLIGGSSGSDGHVTVSGPGSIWDPFDNIYVGFEGTGELDVLDGATVSTEQTGGGAATIYIGFYNGGQGTVTVSSSTGDTSTLSVTDDLRVGVDGAAVMNIAKGGLVRVGDNVHIADTGTSSGTLHLNGDATGRGVLETGSVVSGIGTVDLDLNGGILRANRNEANFLNGFTALTVGTEGAWIDTNTHDIGISTAFTGTSAFNKLGAGTLTLTGNSSTFTGNTEVQAGTLQVDGILGGPTDVLAGARLTGIGQVGVTTNRGVIAPGHVGSLGTLTIAGNYTPAGGSIAIRTQLGDDSSPTDRLVITGSTSGTTPVTVTNFGGTGAQTTEGIKVIDVAGASSGTFTLLGTTTYEGDQAVVAGAYAYRLYQGGASTPADGDWYLRSVLRSVSAPPDTPLYQPGVPSYEAYSQILLGLNGVPTLQQRVGNRFWGGANASSSTGNGNGASGAFTETNGMWVRVEGGHSRIDPKYSTSGSDYEYDMVKTQVGLDALLSQDDSGKLVGGLSVHYVHGSAESSWRYGVGNYGAGDISTDGYGLGGTLTWYGNNGFYVDGTAQATWYSSDLSAHPVGSLANSNDAFGYALSIEGGKRIAMNQGWSFTPQAQLIYSKARFDNFSDVFGASVRPGRDDSLQGRLGISLERQINRTHLYGIANVYNEFFDGTSVTVGNQSFSSRKDRLWAGIGVGGSHNWDNDKYSIYGEGIFNTSLAGGDSHGYGATIGFRMRW
ncbi:autotransporter [Oxalicibacterium flavum]|uniref:Autotransporter n=2 Tax=Oxalicibacterium flavum TaxID=179467 RepID=A0A8J2UL19_9BURK|nr:autotransporter [Oxalicibacterium flavum]